MSEGGSLQIGDVVTHPSWRGETRTVINMHSFRRLGGTRKHPKLVADPPGASRIIIVDRPIDGGPEFSDGAEDGWMEAGLIKVAPQGDLP